MSNPIQPINIDALEAELGLEDKDYTVWRSKVTIVFGKIDALGGIEGWKDEWEMPSILPEYRDALRERINKRILQRYKYLELGTLPPRRFKDTLVYEITRSVAKLAPIYNSIAKGVDLQTKGTDRTIARDVNSEYPQAQLNNEGEDYASSAVDRASEESGTLSQLELFERYGNFMEPDSILIEEIRPCFSYIYSTNF